MGQQQVGNHKPNQNRPIDEKRRKIRKIHKTPFFAGPSCRKGLQRFLHQQEQPCHPEQRLNQHPASGLVDLVIFGVHDHTNPMRQRGIQPFLPRWRFGLVLNQHPASAISLTQRTFRPRSRWDTSKHRLNQAQRPTHSESSRFRKRFGSLSGAGETLQRRLRLAVKRFSRQSSWLWGRTFQTHCQRVGHPTFSVARVRRETAVDLNRQLRQDCVAL